MTFVDEVQKALKHAIDSDYTLDNALLELNKLKFAHNASDGDCIEAIVPIILNFIQPEALSSSINQSVAKWARLLGKFVHLHTDELTVLHGLASFLSSLSLLPALKFLLPLFYKVDIVNDGSILEWYNSSDPEVKVNVSDFVEWILSNDSDVGII
jgi:hypothetical protein